MLYLVDIKDCRYDYLAREGVKNIHEGGGLIFGPLWFIFGPLRLHFGPLRLHFGRGCGSILVWGPYFKIKISPYSEGV